MARVLFIVAVLVALFFAVPVMTHLKPVIGTGGVALVGLACALMAAWAGHTPETAAMAEDFRGALRDHGISNKEAAITAGVSEPTFTNWLSGKERPPLWVLVKFSEAVRVSFYRRQLARAECVVIERGELCDLVNAVQVMTAERRRPISFRRSEVA